MIKVLADHNLFKIHQFIPPEAELDVFDPSRGLPDHWGEYHALLIRTVTPINTGLFRNNKPELLSFIGSGSAGFDHVDLSVLQKYDIDFSHAPGCNARAVAEYVITALLNWSNQKNRNLEDMQIGVIGVGHVGTELIKLLDVFEFPFVSYDPPRAYTEESFTSTDLETLLESDILTFHTPLTYNSEYPTYHWLDNHILSQTGFDLIINAARGGIIDEQVLLKSKEEEKTGSYILDVWEREPRFRDPVARNAFIRTPHIAGYSRQAKSRATRMICASLADRFDLSSPPPLPQSTIDYDDTFENIETGTLSEILQRIHPMSEYQKALDQLIGLPDYKKARKFARIRTERTFRNEYGYIKIPERLFDQHPALARLGLQNF